jgi:MFS family permease
LWAPGLRRLTAGLVISTTLIAVEALAVMTIMPRIAHDLGDLQLYGWVFSSFMLGSLLGTVAAGRGADRSGPAGAFLAGLALFAAGLVVDGAAPSMAALVVGRTLQGLGAGAIEATAYVAVGRGLPEQLRPRMFAVLSTAWVLPGLLGPALSAEVAALFGWRWVFFGLLPLLAAGALLVLPALRRLALPRGDAKAGEHQLRDALAVALGCGMLLAGLTSREAPIAIGLVAAGLFVGVAGLRRLLPAGTLSARRGLPAVILSRGLLTFAFFGADAFVTLMITTVLHHSLATATIAITSSTLSWTAGAWVQARLAGEREGRALVRVGLALVLIGIGGMLAALRPAVPVGEAIAAWTLAGFGIGLAYAPTSLMMLAHAPAGREGSASASLALADVLGIALGTGIGGAAIALGSNRGWAMSTSVAVAFAIAAAGAVAGLAVSGRLPLEGAARRRPARTLAAGVEGKGA